MNRCFFNSFLLAVFVLLASTAMSQKQMEYLNRGTIAISQGGGKVYLGWRMLGTDSPDVSFNVYRSTGVAKAIKLNSKPISNSTNFVDGGVDTTKSNTYFVKVLSQGKEVETGESFTLPPNASVQQYFPIRLKAIPGYTPNDASVGDLDGDGQYEIILHQTGRGRDTPSPGITDAPIFQAYKLDGTLLWEINLGKNIREGAHYTQFIVIDMDGDGVSEFACKTADGTIDGKGKVIGDSTKDWRNLKVPERNTFYGKILDGPEYFTVFSGKTGQALATTDYIPGRYPLNGWNGHGGNGGGDSTGNRVDRFVAGAAYLDGKLPSVLMCRGYYGRTVIAAWDYRAGKLTSRWVFDSKDGENPYSGQGNHGLSIADVDNDGKDEVIYGAMVINDDGKGIFSTNLRHGDALHVTDLDPQRPGLEVFGVHEIEEGTKGPGAALYDAKTGKILWTGHDDEDVGRGVAENIDSSNPGAEMWFSGSNGLLNLKGEKIGPDPTSTNFVCWWDADLTRELLNGNGIDKYKVGRIFTATGCSSNNGSKSTPALSADILGDWREELILRTTDNKELRIYTTTIPTQHKMYTLMHDSQYRMAIAWQNVAYNQPPHPSFYIGEDMKPAPKPKIILKRPGTISVNR